MNKQRTLACAAELRGIGIHSGRETEVRFEPAEAGSGIAFRRLDIEGSALIPADVRLSVDKERRSALGLSDQPGQVMTIEHALAALAGLGIDNAIVGVRGVELPGGDGSARAFLEVIERAGIRELDAERRLLRLDRPLHVEDDSASILALPGDGGLHISYELDYGSLLGGPQRVCLHVDEETFAAEICPARTFCLESEALALRAAGLGKGANFENTLVIGEHGPIQNRYRFPDEPARHKVLDLLGDLALLGADLHARIYAWKSGHRLNRQLVAELSRIREERELLQSASWSERESLDRMLAIDGPEGAVAVRDVSASQAAFAGHFPDRPILPGIVALEAMIDLARLHLRHRYGVEPVLVGVRGARFRSCIVPGDRVTVKARAEDSERVRASAFVGNRVAATATFSFE